MLDAGDKTFLIAAIMATRHPRLTVFGGAFGSLVVMSILSAAMGRVILGLVPKVKSVSLRRRVLTFLGLYAVCCQSTGCLAYLLTTPRQPSSS